VIPPSYQEIKDFLHIGDCPRSTFLCCAKSAAPVGHRRPAFVEALRQFSPRTNASGSVYLLLAPHPTALLAASAGAKTKPNRKNQLRQ